MLERSCVSAPVTVVGNVDLRCARCRPAASRSRLAHYAPSSIIRPATDTPARPALPARACRANRSAPPAVQCCFGRKSFGKRDAPGAQRFSCRSRSSDQLVVFPSSHSCRARCPMTARSEVQARLDAGNHDVFVAAAVRRSRAGRSARRLRSASFRAANAASVPPPSADASRTTRSMPAPVVHCAFFGAARDAAMLRAAAAGARTSCPPWLPAAAAS